MRELEAEGKYGRASEELLGKGCPIESAHVRLLSRLCRGSNPPTAGLSLRFTLFFFSLPKSIVSHSLYIFCNMVVHQMKTLNVVTLANQNQMFFSLPFLHLQLINNLGELHVQILNIAVRMSLYKLLTTAVTTLQRRILS
ncbi:unnamed protein product [Sphenostylis stenocarpa]|uniref:Uncharacterized protein n=1 Tax=Sphenostylis stenocarpa TaxID=92480 RepID=A0AA86RT10_9FABA|nr:unnamed protein product [Sphenostylis stenocarpa]